MTGMTAPARQPGRRGGQRVFSPHQVYLGWQYAVRHPDPGPRPRRPTPPGQYQLNPGWLAAQRREERLLNRPARMACAAALALAAALPGLWLAGLLSAPAAIGGMTACLLGGSVSGSAIWRRTRALGARIEREQRRLAVIRADRESRLSGRQREHARAVRDWQARRAEFERQPRWYAVSVPAGIGRVDVAGGTLSGWTALTSMMGATRLSTGGEVTVIDLSGGAVAGDLAAVARRCRIDPLVWVLPGDLPRLDLGTGLGGAALADVLSLVVSVSEDQGGTRGLARDNAILEPLTGVLGDRGLSVGRVTAALRALAQEGDPRDDIRRGLIGTAQLDAIARLSARPPSRWAAGQAVAERARVLESQLRKLEPLGTAPSGLPPARLRIVATDPRTGVFGNNVLGTCVAAALSHMLRRVPPDTGEPPGEHAATFRLCQRTVQPWQHTVLLVGAEKLRGDVLDRLIGACEHTRTGLVLCYRSVPAASRERIGRGTAAVAFMRPENAGDARAAAERIGTGHRFVLSQLTETVAAMVAGTSGDSYTSTVSAPGAVPAAASGTQAVTGSAAITGAPITGAPITGAPITGPIRTGSAWGVSTSQAAGGSEPPGDASQRAREFPAGEHELQQLPPTAMILCHNAGGRRRVVLADANPGILTLPTASVTGLEEAGGHPGMAGQPDGADGAGADGAGPDGADGAGADGVYWPGARPWRGGDQPPPNLGPPPDRLDWRKPRR